MKFENKFNVFKKLAAGGLAYFLSAGLVESDAPSVFDESPKKRSVREETISELKAIALTAYKYPFWESEKLHGENGKYTEYIFKGSDFAINLLFNDSNRVDLISYFGTFKTDPPSKIKIMDFAHFGGYGLGKGGDECLIISNGKTNDVFETDSAKANIYYLNALKKVNREIELRKKLLDK